MMKKQVLRTISLSVVLMLAVALSGCSGDKQSRETDSNPQSEPVATGTSDEEAGITMGGSMVVGIPQDLEDSLDPHYAVAAGTKEILFNIYEGLYKPDSTGDLVPAVASDSTISEDKMTYTFTLRDGVKFHNGDEVTVEDIKYSIERCADTSDGDPLVSAYSIISSVNIVDDSHLEVVLMEPNAEFLAYMTTAIIPKDSENLETAPVGTGPFRFVSRSPQENFIVEKFEDYWGTPAYLDKVEFKIISDADTIVMNMKGGSIDMFARITSAQADELGDEFTIEEGTMNLVQALFLNNAVAPFDNILVRQALSYAIDPQEIIELMADGKGTVIGSNMFPAFEKYYVEELKDVYTKDIDKAKELLAQAGYEDGFEMTITVPSNYLQHVDTATVIIEQLKEIGVTATIELIEWDSWLSDVYGSRDYQSTVIGLDAATLTARALLERFETDNSRNFINFSNTEYDKLFQKAISTADDDEQIELYKEMQQILTEDAASVYIQDMANLVAMNKEYAGYVFYPLYAQDMSTIYRVAQ